MITFFFFLIATPIFFIIVDMVDDWWPSNLFFGILYGLFLGLIFGLITSFFLPNDTKPVVTTYQIECLQDNSNVSGSFFIGCGSVNNRMKYTYYYDCGDSTYVLEQIDVDDVKIKYTNEKPYVDKIKYKQTDNWINLFSFELRNPTYIIYVPKGSIMNNYNLDTK